jgi:alkaline phosphatase
VIIMIPDGMGLTNVTATRTRLNGPAGAPLNLETLDRVGYMRTHSETNTVTDSSAAASAFACGEKFVNNEVCYHADGRPNNQSLLELAKSRGMATGLVATQTITHATPAAFASHLAARKCENEIARQYVMETQPDVLLGGGRATFKTATLTSGCPSPGDFIAAALGQGYTYVTTSDEMWKAASGSTGKVLGLFADTYLTPEYQRKKGGAQPGLPDMTAVALAILERKQAGFFLMVEGSLIDSANHAENPDYQFGEMLAFDESVKVVLNWINASPERKEETLLIVVPDHETGGFAMLGSETPGAGLGPFTSGWTFTLYPNDPKDFEAHHTAGDLVLWSQGPGSDELARPIDNTWVYGAVKRAMRQ